MTAMQSVCRKPTQLLRPLARLDDVQKIGNYLPSNVLGAPHMIQTKVPGDKLYHTYPTMTSEEKRSVVQQVAHLLGQMSWISMSSIDILGEGANVVGPFKDHLAQTNVAFIPPTVLTFFRFLLLDSISTSTTNLAKTL